MRVKLALASMFGVWLALAPSASAVSKNVEHLTTLPEAKYATAINFLSYDRGRTSRDVMLVTLVGSG